MNRQPQHPPLTAALPAPNAGPSTARAASIWARLTSEQRGLMLGLLGVVIFALTLPMTRLAVGTETQPQLSTVFVAFGRAAVAGVLSACLLLATRAPLPRRADIVPLLITAAAVVFGFPLLTSLAMRHVEAVHASVVVGMLPLATAAVGALLHQQKPSGGFWLCALGGTAPVMVFTVLRSGSAGLAIQTADLLLIAAILLAAVGYAYGARLALHMRSDQVICWALVVSLPLTVPVAIAFRPGAGATIATPSWWAFAYVAVFSMWLGFFAWYRGLALGGTVRVSQVQLVQPFLSMVFAVPLLGETLDGVTIGFGLAVVACVLVGKKMPVQQDVRQETQQSVQQNTYRRIQPGPDPNHNTSTNANRSPRHNPDTDHPKAAP